MKNLKTTKKDTMSLAQLRRKIDATDRDLLRLLNERTGLSEQVGAIKRASGSAVFAPHREEILLRQLVKRNRGPLDHTALRAIYREILSASRARQKRLTVGYLGPAGTYSHQSALERFGSSDRFVPCRSIPEVFALLSCGEADACVVPVANSIEGGVSATLDMLMNTDLVICGEIYQRIRHVLAAAADTADGDLKKIYSHPQALGQCRQWLLRHLPNAEQLETSSTSQAAQLAKQDADSGAIASAFAAKLYGLKVWHTNIQDVARNQTRFVILSRQLPAPSGDDKTSLLFAVPHEIGSLNDVLKLFAEHRINLQKIESRPSAHKEWEYLFFVDVNGHCQQPKLRRAFALIQKKTLWLKVLGSYPQAQNHG
ncbi:MAG: prephenate dehydratase [Verrucomicrobiales bacterium]|jgi:chorismate mutase/prephenate dehydratase|nr:prephenate dehydratase [Verrucomicrobiales bacterium]